MEPILTQAEIAVLEHSSYSCAFFSFNFSNSCFLTSAQNSDENFEGLEPTFRYLCVGRVDFVVFEILTFLHVPVRLYY